VTRPARAATLALQILAAALSLSILAAAWHDVSTAWDVWYYHLPFAARLAGVVPAEAYAFHARNQGNFDGFPLLGELLQGLLWRVTGRPECANLVAAGSVAFFVWRLHRDHRVPPHLAALGLLAIPLVQLHASACYVDLPANLAASLLVLAVIRLHAAPEPPSALAPLYLLGLAGVAANMRFQLHPVVALALVVAAPRLLPPLFRGPRLHLALVAVALPLAFFSPLKNLVVHHNPYYPMRLSVAGLALPGREDPYSSAPAYLEHAPRALRWLYSVLEIGIRPLTERRRWTIDQWMPAGSDGERMGGFFGAYVVFHVALLGWLAARDRTSPVARRSALAFAGLTVVTAVLPQSHELRYYLYWMIVLVALNLSLVCARPDADRRAPALGAACALALGVVLAVTRAGYAYPSGSTFAEIVAAKVDAGVLGRVREGDRVCLSKEPWTFLYAAPFHAPRRYSVRETDRREDCGDHRWEE
jgi:hypothetical protein